VIVTLAVAGACGQSPRMLHPNDPATDFYQVSEGIYRGGRPDQAGVQALAKLGVKTIVNLENDDDAIANETKWATAAAIHEISSPMSGSWTPNEKQVDKILATLADKSLYPIYIHCKKGMDRTGVIVALHRVVNEGWAVAKAEHEMDDIGFNSWLVNLDRYYASKAHRVALHRPAPVRTAAAPHSGVAAH
jgi:protein tyrosine/serine phosphatase